MSATVPQVCAPLPEFDGHPFHWLRDAPLGNEQPCGWDHNTRRWQIIGESGSWSAEEFGADGYVWLRVAT